jgi:hypothetical protein
MVILCITYDESVVKGFDSFSPWGLGFNYTVIHVGFGEKSGTETDFLHALVFRSHLTFCQCSIFIDLSSAE